MSFDAKSFVAGLTEPTGFKAVSGGQQFLLIGYDNYRRLAFNIRGAFRGSIPKSTQYLETSEGIRANGDRYFQITLKDPRFLRTFLDLLDSLIDRVSNITDTQHAFEKIKEEFIRWKRLFGSPSNSLTEEERIGLVGELAFLKEYAIPTWGPEAAVGAWCGSDGAKKDFFYLDTWYEIKSVKVGLDSVTITSLEQLDGDSGHLVLIRYEKKPDVASGTSLKNLISWMRDNLPVDMAEVVIGAAVSRGYSHQDETDQKYQLAAPTFYAVRNGFPRLTREEIPSTIKNIRYEILLASLENFREE